MVERLDLLNFLYNEKGRFGMGDCRLCEKSNDHSVVKIGSHNAIWADMVS